MRIIGRILKWLAIVIVIAIAAIAGLPWIPVGQDALTGGPFKAHLEKSAVALDLDSRDAAFTFEDDFYDKSLILMGEIHGIAAAQTLDLALLTHLSENTWLCGYVAELDPAQAWAFNHFLNTGDDRHANTVFDAWAANDAQWGNREFRAKLDGIRDLNATLPAEDEIRFIGVDRIQDRALAESLREAAPIDVRPQIDAALARAEAVTARYPIIMENMQAVADAAPTGCTYYGFWGFFHAVKATVTPDLEPMAKRLNADGGAFAGAVGTITLSYVMSEMLVPSATAGPLAQEGADMSPIPFSEDTAYLYYTRGIGEAVKAADRVHGGGGPVFQGGAPRATLFRLAGDDSPYAPGVKRFHRTSGYLEMLVGSVEMVKGEGPRSDYVIVLEGSGPVTDWD